MCSGVHGRATSTPPCVAIRRSSSTFWRKNSPTFPIARISTRSFMICMVMGSSMRILSDGWSSLKRFLISLATNIQKCFHWWLESLGTIRAWLKFPVPWWLASLGTTCAWLKFLVIISCDLAETEEGSIELIGRIQGFLG